LSIEQSLSSERDQVVQSPPRPTKKNYNNVVIIEQKQYWHKKSNFTPVLNLAAINAEKNIFELSNPNSHVVHKGKFHHKK
jgi:hypothetical protein